MRIVSNSKSEIPIPKLEKIPNYTSLNFKIN